MRCSRRTQRLWQDYASPHRGPFASRLYRPQHHGLRRTYRRGKSPPLRAAAESGIARRPCRRSAPRSRPLRAACFSRARLLPRNAPAHRHRTRSHPPPFRAAPRRAGHRPRSPWHHLAGQFSSRTQPRRLHHRHEPPRRIGNFLARHARRPPRCRQRHRRHENRRVAPRHPHLWSRLTAAMSLFSNTAVLLSKELRTEFRSRELLTTTVVFILVVLILFSFAISHTTEESREFGPGLLWLAILFAASLMLQP